MQPLQKLVFECKSDSNDEETSRVLYKQPKLMLLEMLHDAVSPSLYAMCEKRRRTLGEALMRQAVDVAEETAYSMTLVNIVQLISRTIP